MNRGTNFCVFAAMNRNSTPARWQPAISHFGSTHLIGELPGNQRRDEARQRQRRVDPARLLAAHLERTQQPCRQDGAPCSPNGELEEEQQAELNVERCIHDNLLDWNGRGTGNQRRGDLPGRIVDDPREKKQVPRRRTPARQRRHPPAGQAGSGTRRPHRPIRVARVRTDGHGGPSSHALRCVRDVPPSRTDLRLRNLRGLP